MDVASWVNNFVIKIAPFFTLATFYFNFHFDISMCSVIALLTEYKDLSTYRGKIMTVDEVVKFFGNGVQREAAHELGIDPSTITQWRKRGGIPYFTQHAIEGITQGKLKSSRTLRKEAMQ
jgi:hypothetical protein